MGSIAIPAPPSAALRRVSPFSEIGTTGLKQYGGFVLEEWLRELSGRREAWAYREMLDNDPVVGGIMFAIKMLARKVSWRVEGNDERAEFVWSVMHDMSQTWVDFVCEALSMVPYGWSFHEIVYKRRLGYRRHSPRLATPETEEDQQPASSQYNDGLIGWRKLPARAQETLLRWIFDGYGSPVAMEQIDWHGGRHVIPFEKGLLFRTETTRNNPQGRSVLRNCFTAFYALKNLQQLELIGAERDLAGIPVLTPPEGVDVFAPQNAELREKAAELVAAIRRDEHTGVLLPSAGWKLELLRAAGERQVETDKVIRRYEQRIASSLLADFILIGQDAVGSYAMVDVKSDLFGIAMDTVLDLICEPLNHYGIPRLLRINGMSTEEPPRIAHSSAGRLDLEKVGAFFRDLAAAGAAIPWTEELFGELFKEAGLPATFRDTAVETQTRPTGLVHPLEGPVAKASQEEAQEETDAERTFRAMLEERANARVEELRPLLLAALDSLGRDAAHTYARLAEQEPPRLLRTRRRLVARVMRELRVAEWVTRELLPLLESYADKVAADVAAALEASLGQEVPVTEDVRRTVRAHAGEHISPRSFERNARELLERETKEANRRGETVTQTANRLRAAFPAAPWTYAGTPFRASLIASNQIAAMQRAAVIALAALLPVVTGFRLRDGVYGPPRSDARCIARDGQFVPLAAAWTVHPYHPNCTLGFIPSILGR
jgi:hypothetical protein